MKLGTNGLVTNENGEVLLIQRDDTRTFAPPGGGMEAGELPPENIAREVREETGIIALPVRLVHLAYLDWGDTSLLNFTFRCIQRGGQLTLSDESIGVGFFPVHHLPTPMVRLHRERIERGFFHHGGPPEWFVEKEGLMLKLGRLALTGIYRWRDWRRQRRGETVYVATPEWRVGAFTVIRNEKGEALWLKRNDIDLWNLPGGGALPKEPPWETAVRETYEETGLSVHLTDLTGVYVYENEAHIIFTFTADIQSGTLTTGPEAVDFGWFAPGAEPENSFAAHVQRVADAVDEIEITQFRFQFGKTPVR